MRKHHILYIVLISILSLIYVNSISALSYSNDVGVSVSVSFTFNPTISISLSSANLDISNFLRLKHPWNIPYIFVTFSVLKLDMFMLGKDKHWQNIQDKLEKQSLQ